MSNHILKTTQPWWERVALGQKTAEIRRHDRDFQVGDTLELVETYAQDGRHLDEEGGTVWHKAHTETGSVVVKVVTHILPAAQFPTGLNAGFCLLSMADQQTSKENQS